HPGLADPARAGGPVGGRGAGVRLPGLTKTAGLRCAMRILFGSVISIVPFSPGMAWNWMHHAVGLQRLGHDVYYLEEVEPRWCVDSRGRPCGLDESLNRSLFRAIMERFGFRERACQIWNGGEATFGMDRCRLAALCREADLLLNISGHVKT